MSSADAYNGGHTTTRAVASAGRVPPQAIEAEQSVLGAMLLEKEAIGRAAEILEPDCFYRDAHRKVFEAVVVLYERNESADLITVTEELRRRGHLEAVGGAGFVASLLDTVPTAANVSYHAELVLEKATLRRLIEVATSIVQRGYEAADRSGEIIDQAEEMIFSINDPRMRKSFVSLKELLPGAVEMSQEQLVMRLLSSQARIPAHRLRTGYLRPEEWDQLAQAAGVLSEAPIYIDDTPAISVTEMRAKARRLKKEHNCGLLVVDYLQLMRGYSSSESRQQEISTISRSLKALAKELDIPILALSQLSRAVEQRDDKRPMLSDLRESGAIEQDADVVLFIFREEFYKPEKSDVKGMAEVIVGKHRNGPVGRVHLTFIGELARFESYTERVYDEDPF